MLILRFMPVYHFNNTVRLNESIFVLVQRRSSIPVVDLFGFDLLTDPILHRFESGSQSTFNQFFAMLLINKLIC